MIELFLIWYLTGFAGLILTAVYEEASIDDQLLKEFALFSFAGPVIPLLVIRELWRDWADDKLFKGDE